jgi:hypothetical protein
MPSPRAGPPQKAVGGEGLANQLLPQMLPAKAGAWIGENAPFSPPDPPLGTAAPAAKDRPPGTRLRPVELAKPKSFHPRSCSQAGVGANPASGLKGYSSVGRVAVSKTAGRGFESLCPCQARQIRRTRLLRSVTAGKPVPSRSPPPLVARRRHLPDLPALVSRHQRGRDRRSAGDHPEACLYRRPRRGSDLDIPLLQVADERFRL